MQITWFWTQVGIFICLRVIENILFAFIKNSSSVIAHHTRLNRAFAYLIMGHITPFIHTYIEYEHQMKVIIFAESSSFSFTTCYAAVVMSLHLSYFCCIIEIFNWISTHLSRFTLLYSVGLWFPIGGSKLHKLCVIFIFHNVKKHVMIIHMLIYFSHK